MRQLRLGRARAVRRLLAGYGGQLHVPTSRLASRSVDTTARRLELDAHSGTFTTVMVGHTRSVLAFAVLPDVRLATGSAGQTAQTIRCFDRGAVAAAILAASSNGELRVSKLSQGWLTRNSRPEERLLGPYRYTFFVEVQMRSVGMGAVSRPPGSGCGAALRRSDFGTVADTDRQQCCPCQLVTKPVTERRQSERASTGTAASTASG